MSEFASWNSTVVWQFSLSSSSLRSWPSFDFSLFHFTWLFVWPLSAPFIVLALFNTRSVARRLAVAGMQWYCTRKLSAVVNEGGRRAHIWVGLATWAVCGCCSECSAFTLSGKIFECIDVALRCLVQAMQLEFFPSELYMYIPYVHMCDKLSNVPGLHLLVCRMFVTTFSWNWNLLNWHI